MAEQRLIDANRLLSVVCGTKCGCYSNQCGYDDNFCRCDIGAFIDVAPTVDAVPVVHGEWLEDDYNVYHCSLCKWGFGDPEDSSFKFCPSCGACMDLSQKQHEINKITEDK